MKYKIIFRLKLKADQYFYLILVKFEFSGDIIKGY